MELIGKTTFVALGAGFWGILGHDGKKYRPANLPINFQKEGLQVRFVFKVSPQQVSIMMWGVAIDLQHIELHD